MHEDPKNNFNGIETDIVTDYEQYDIKHFEGEDKTLLAEDFIPLAKKNKNSSIYDRPKPQNTLFPIIFMLLSLFMSMLYWNGYVTHPLGISQNSFFDQGNYWQSITAIFMHADLGHFLSNSWLLFLFGWFLKDFGTSFAFPLFSLLIGIVTNILTILTQPAYVYLVGASGMVYGMVSMWIVFYMYYSESTFKEKIMGSVAFLLVVMFPESFQENVSYAAHIIGFLFGIVFGIAYIFGDKLFLKFSNRQKSLPN